MKTRIVIVLVCFAVAIMAGSAFAANSLNSGAVAISIGVGDSALNNVANPTDSQPRNPIVDISMRYLTAKDMALTGGLGFQMNSGDLEGTYLSFNVGLRKYLRSDDFAPFVAGQFSYITYDAELPPAAGGSYADYSAFEFAGLFGAEYFFGKNFSVEGSIGIALGKAEDNLTNRDTTYIGTKNLGLKANFYF